MVCSLLFLSFQNQVRVKAVRLAMFLFWIYSGTASNTVSYFLAVKTIFLSLPELCRAFVCG